MVEYAATATQSATGNYLSPFFGFAPSLSQPAQSITLTGYTATTSAVIFNALNNLVPGQSVTISATPSTYNGTYSVLSAGLSGTSFEVTFSGTAVATLTSISGTATTAASTQSYFTCPSATASSGCAVVGSPISSKSIAIDRAGSIWTLQPSGTLVEIIGTAAPTDPITTDGAYGVAP